ncbi:unnamed protein product, partial [marine sediment metagenome]
MKAQTTTEYLMTYGWAFLLLVIVLGLLYQLGLFDISNYVQSSSEVVGFNSFNINRFIVRSNGELEIGLSNMLE